MSDAQPMAPGFIYRFMLMAVISGTGLGLGRITSQLYLIHLHATPFQMGIISALEQAATMGVVIPAGVIIARFGPRLVYAFANIGPLILYALMPFLTAWPLVGAARVGIGLCTPFRMVSMNTSFLRVLPQVGPEKAGWYRGSLSIGIALIGPSLAAFMTGHFGYGAAFVLAGLMFGLLAYLGRKFLPDNDPSTQPGGPPAPLREQLRLILAEREVFESCVIETVSSSAISLFNAFILVLAIKELGLPSSQAVALVAFQGATSVASLFYGARFYVRFPRLTAYAIALVIGIAALLCLGLGHSFIVLGLGAAMLSGASSMVHFRNVTELSKSAADKSQISSLYNLATMSGAVGGSLGGALMSHVMRLQVIFLVWIAVLVVAAATIAVRETMSRRAKAD